MYLNVVCILHLEHGLTDPTKNNFQLATTLRGIKPAKGLAVFQREPITPQILLAFKSHLSLDNPSLCIYIIYISIYIYTTFCTQKLTILLSQGSHFRKFQRDCWKLACCIAREAPENLSFSINYFEIKCPVVFFLAVF